MKYLFALITSVLIATAFTAQAQSPDDQYVRIYTLMQQADALNEAGQSPQALGKYLEAQTSLQRLQKVYPEWNPKVVSFRLNYIEGKVTLLTSKASASDGTGTESASADAQKSESPGEAAAIDESNIKLADLQNEVRQLQADKTVLEAKLKEALATQPAAIDARELAKAEEKIQSLMKENDLLKVAIAKPQGENATGADQKTIDETKLALAETARKLSDEIERTKAVTAEKESLQKKLDSLAASTVSADELEAAKQSLEAANARLEAQAGQTDKLTAEKDSLQSRLEALTAAVEATDALRAENELLKKQLTEIKSAASVAVGDADQKQQLAQAQAQLAALQSDADVLRLEKAALQDRIKEAASMGDANARRVKELEDERDSLRKKLARTERGGFFRRRSTASTAQIKDLSDQVESMRSRLQVLEAQAVPYTAEEQALFQKSGPQLAGMDVGSVGGSSKNLPAGTTTLVAEAQRLFSNKQYDEAEKKYLEILRQDQSNVYTLANLAAIQLEMGRLDEAEKNLKQALTASPNDAYSLSILGYLKYRQEKYDEALDALSRAAQLQPKNAEVQNYLGVTLSHKGMRGPAESALRRAIQIDPNYGSAHNNLAVIYATQQPPLLGLARWHYQKALAAGHPHNPDLEKMLEQKSSNAAPVAP